MKAKQFITKEQLRQHGNDIFAYSGLIFCILIFSIFPPIIKGVNILDPSSLAFKNIIADGVTYSILASGAVFV